jgi:hypothetical protein
MVTFVHWNSADLAHAFGRLGIASEGTKGRTITLPTVAGIIAKMTMAHLPPTFKKGHVAACVPLRNVIGGLLLGVDQEAGVGGIR